MQLYSIYLGLKGVPVSVLWGLCRYYKATWTLSVETWKAQAIALRLKDSYIEAFGPKDHIM